MSLTKVSYSMIDGAPANVKDYGASSTNTDVQNKTILQSLIQTISNSGGGTIVIPAEIDYGFKLATPSSYPDFSTITGGDVVILDQSACDNETVGKPGAQTRTWFGTVQTSPKGQHDGNGNISFGNWHPFVGVELYDWDDTVVDPCRASLAVQVNDIASSEYQWYTAGVRDATGAATNFAEKTGFGLVTFPNAIYNLSTSAWRYTGGYLFYRYDRFSGRMAWNGTINTSYAYTFNIPTGTHAKDIIFLGESAAELPSIELASYSTTNRFNITVGTGAASYFISSYQIPRIFFDTTQGNTHIGPQISSTARGHTISKLEAEGNFIASIFSTQSGYGDSANFYSVSLNTFNVAASAIATGKNSLTNRSINAGGTINASGADYAEYMTKASNFTINKGDICGINVNGKLTNVFADAVSFVVKSTNPSYVGGDTWGTEDIVGKKPEDESLISEWKEKIEKERQKVDRIAFAGQVPVNVTGATAGQYIIPINNNGLIKGEAISNPTFEQYQTSVGKVISVTNGVTTIIVKVV